MHVKELSHFRQVRQLVALHNQVWQSSPGIIDLLQNSSDCFILVDEGDQVIGYAFVEEDTKRGFVELQDIAVSPALRQKGGGKALVEAIMARYPYIKLIARIQNEPLINFYRQLGFKDEMAIENYYAINQDGLRMSWQASQNKETK